MSEHKDEAMDKDTELSEETPFEPANFDDTDPLALDDEMDELNRLIVERNELQDRLMRALAEAENTRKRGERDRRDAETYGGSKLARDLMSVYDNITRALETVTEEQREQASALIDGIELTRRELLNTFTKHKIERIAPKEGDKFDPKLHQAMFEAPLPGTQAGSIIQLMSEGFVMADRLLRPAQVGVSSGFADPSDSESD